MGCTPLCNLSLIHISFSRHAFATTLMPPKGLMDRFNSSSVCKPTISSLSLSIYPALWEVMVDTVVLSSERTPLSVSYTHLEHADAVLCTWWLGSEAGNAICNVLWGEYNPSAKLPMTFPAHVGQIPIYYQNKSTGRPTALQQTYKASYIDASTRCV